MSQSNSSNQKNNLSTAGRGGTSSSSASSSASSSSAATTASSSSNLNMTQNQTINLLINTTTGNNFDISVESNNTVDNLKKVISKKLKVNKDKIILLFKER